VCNSPKKPAKTQNSFTPAHLHNDVNRHQVNLPNSFSSAVMPLKFRLNLVFFPKNPMNQILNENKFIQSEAGKKNQRKQQLYVQHKANTSTIVPYSVVSSLSVHDTMRKNNNNNDHNNYYQPLSEKQQKSVSQPASQTTYSFHVILYC
jgi:hypothetical protein